jgi:signal transduction histidine kinase
MARLVDALLTLAGLERGAARPITEVIPLARVVEEAIASVDAGDVALEVDCTADAAAAVDRDLLVQSIGNVVTNAVQHTNGRVRITGRLAGSDALLDVSDFGPGIPPDVGGRIFERFFRATPKDRRGSGLGLAIARAAANAAGARIDLLPQRDGEGATFRFTMPGARVR